MEQKIDDFNAILDTLDDVLNTVAQKQIILRKSVTEKNWEALLEITKDINRISNYFEDVDAIRNEMQKKMTQEELSPYLPKLRELRSKLLKCKGENKALVEYDVELVMFDQYVNYTNSQIEQHSFDDNKGSRLFINDDCRKLQKRVLNFNGWIAMAFMKLIRIDYLRDHNIRHIDELRQGAEGFVFNIQLYEHLERAYYLDKPLLHYIYNSQSISHTANVKNNMLIIDCMRWIDEYVKTSRNPEPLHPWVLNRMLYIT